MKKTLILNLLISVAILSAGIWTACTIWNQHDAVTFRQNILTGDAADADGLTVHMNVSEGSNQFWDVTHTLGTNQQTEVIYDYTLLEDDDRVLGPIRADEPVPVAIRSDFRYSTFYTKELHPEEFPVQFRDLARNFKDGKENAKTVPLNQLVSFYPLLVDLEFPSMSASWTQDAYWSSLNHKNDKGAMAKELSAEFQDFFRIPIAEETPVTLSISHGSHYQALFDVPYNYMPDFQTFSAFDETACYFAIQAETAKTGALDMSQIRDGFGIYKLPFNSQDGILPQLSTIYRIDPTAEIQHLEISPSGDVLHLHTVENGRYMITFIDVATGRELQKLDVGDLDITSKSWNVITGDDWILLKLSRLEYILVSRQPDGTYVETLHLNIPESEVPWNAITATSDGSRIALATSTYSYFYNGGDFITAIYGPEGLEYYAEYESSLSLTSSRGDFIRTGDLQLEWR